MTVLIFENDFNEVEPIFDALKLDYDDFDFKYYTKSQDAGEFEEVLKFEKILVDLKLADGTQLEGYDILTKLKTSGYNMKNVAVITGHTDYRSRLNAMGLDDVTVFEKPLNIDELEAFLGYV